MIEIVLALMLGCIAYFSDDIFSAVRVAKHKHLTSFVAGVSVAYLFMQLLPEFTSKAWHYSRSLFLTILIGFSMYHLTEKYLYKRHAHRTAFRQAHSAFILFYHFIIGVVLADIVNFGTVETLLFFIPVSLHLGMSSVVEHHIHEELMEKMTQNRWVKVLVSFIIVLGALIGSLGILKPMFTLVLMGIFAGSMFYIVIREAIPRNDKGEPLFFVIGAAGFTILLFVLWNLPL